MPKTRRRRQTDPVVTTTSSETQTINANEEEENQQSNDDSDGRLLGDPKQTVEIVSSDSDEESSISVNSKPKLQIFKGSSDRITIENWMKRFEMLAMFYKWNDKTKIVMLGNYLEDDSLNWYIENCLDTDNFDSIKCKIISRFGLEATEPIIEFINLKYDVKQGIKSYFENKRRYGVAAKLSEFQMIPVLIQGLHPKMAEYFTAVKPKSFVEFYSIAQTAENNFKRSIYRNSEQNSIKTRPKVENDKPKRKPPKPCMICERIGFKNRFHWANECRNKGKNTSQTSDKTINTVRNDCEDQSENDITRIDLKN